MESVTIHTAKRRFGALKGVVSVGPEFFDPLPEQDLADREQAAPGRRHRLDRGRRGTLLALTSGPKSCNMHTLHAAVATANANSPPASESKKLSH
jgi:hypothetical protein